MGYRKKGKKYGFGKGLGGSGYLKPTTDPLARYRQPVSPESQYSKRLREKVLKDEVSGPSSLSFRNYSYQKKKQEPYIERVSKSELNEMMQDSLKEAFKKFVEETGKSEVPMESFHVALDAADNVIKRIPRLAKQQEDTEVETNIEENHEPDNKEWERRYWRASGKADYLIGKSESEIKELNEKIDRFKDQLNVEGETDDLVQLNEGRQEKIREKSEQLDSANTIEEVESREAEIREINSDFFNEMDKISVDSDIEERKDKPSEISYQKEEIELEPFLLDQNELDAKRRLDYRDDTELAGY